ncbi:smr domain protein [Pseudooceanicola batsensis HTCC2597]|uniref:Smr domain protein n=1 Tax=Pseudooceanicola batsensis (strain ATCC BAA-863 / DSM 15984 / KCTC 12145 / HTCC2597) TaxID=252305 RepID=A3TXV2_PSEBH|nr:Smr/MutS family protein [Pseudooceanicola batsensis]EAQ02986.1 smr domain protein [Pseudooceanicola batsensis HTCC2597]
MSRRLRPEELDLWRKVAQSTDKLNRPRPKAETRPTPKIARPGPKPEPDPIPEFRIGQAGQGTRPGHELMSSVADRLDATPVRMDRKTHTRLKRGKVKPEARIDLHGMTMDRAHPALTGFIMRSASEGRRLVLVITGKGKDRDGDGPIPVRRGVLRHNVPHWLCVPPLNRLVLQVVPAHVRHGGGGAYYVYLRRLRS